jgi:hypothetical protein
MVQEKATLPEKWLDKDAAAKWIAARKLPITFSSRNGHYYGMDSDASLTIEKDGHVTVLELGVAPMTYEGTYDIDDSGTISLKLPNYKATWPTMHLYTTAKDAWLMRSDQKTDFNVGDRGGATQTSRMAPCWPFRMKKLNQ